MSADEIINYYASLLILQYIGKQKAYETIQLIAQIFVMDLLPKQVQDAFDPATAVGVQLDVIGKYVGVTRTGFGFTTPITLDDEDFRLFIQMAIAKNNSGSSLATIQAFLHQFFDGSIFIVDYTTMRIGYLIDSDFGSQDLIQLFITEGLLPKPMGVKLSPVIYGPDVTHYFGFSNYGGVNPYNVGMNTYATYHMDRPCLTYSDGIN